MRKRTVLFVCRRCSVGVFRAGKNVDQKRKLCGKHGKIQQELDVLKGFAAPQNSPQIERKGAQEARLETNQPNLGAAVTAGFLSNPIAQHSITQLAFYRRKLNQVEKMIPTHTDTPFHELWTLAGREIGE
jgi:hypothetical protein